MDGQISVLEELSQNFIDFSYEANCARAFADARDGLKPGQRACLWEMYDKGYTSKKPHVKSAKITGGVVANWWPHGTTAIYDTFARMSQQWINNMPEVDWHGENGSQIISAEPAADRYTEARLSSIAEEGLLQNIKKNNVPMIYNFSEDAKWPAVFPATLPRLLINGCQGIGVTIANTWLPHALSDCVALITKYIKTHELDITNFFPSFPSGGIIINKDDISKIYTTGKGTVIVRARASCEGNFITFTELPYQVYVEPLIEQIKDLIKNEELQGIVNVYNKSGKEGIAITIECEGNLTSILENLYRKTNLQKSYSANQWALVGKTPKLLTLKEYLDIYIRHNIECITREYQFDIAKAKARLEIVEGLVKALENIDNIIALIKGSENSNAAIENLKSKYNFTDNQAKAIVDMKLGRLCHLEKIELNQEQKSLISNITEWNTILQSSNRLNEIFLDRLSSLDKKFHDSRKTEITQLILEKAKEEPEIIPEDVVVLVTKDNFIKRVARSNFKPSRRNRVGVKNKDIITFSASTNTIDTLMIFTSKGKMYRLLIDKIPATTSGATVSNLINLENNEFPVAFTTLNRGTANKYIVFVTKNGLVKKALLSDFDKMKKNNGVIALGLNDGDEVAAVTMTNDGSDLFIGTRNGYTIRFKENEITPTGRTAKGVKGIKLETGDSIVSFFSLDSVKKIAICSKDNYGKMVEINNYSNQSRGGKGVKNGKDNIIAYIPVINDNAEILITGTNSSLVVAANELPILGKSAFGNKLIKNNSEILTASII